MKLIDILNKIADGTLKDGSIMKYKGDLYEYNKAENKILEKDGERFSDNDFIEDCLNDEVELLIRQEEIAVKTEENTAEEFEEIEELDIYDVCDGITIQANREKINELIRVVNKLIKEE